MTLLLRKVKDILNEQIKTQFANQRIVQGGSVWRLGA